MVNLEIPHAGKYRLKYYGGNSSADTQETEIAVLAKANCWFGTPWVWTAEALQTRLGFSGTRQRKANINIRSIQFR